MKLTLQPLVENALYHGIKNKRGLGHIRVSGEKQEGSLIFRVWDDGRGMESDRLEKVRRLIGGEEEVDRSDPSGFGLFNVAQRLRLNYGAQYGISLESVYGEWTEVTVVIPAVFQK